MNFGDNTYNWFFAFKDFNEERGDYQGILNVTAFMKTENKAENHITPIPLTKCSESELNKYNHEYLEG